MIILIDVSLFDTPSIEMFFIMSSHLFGFCRMFHYLMFAFGRKNLMFDVRVEIGIRICRSGLLRFCVCLKLMFNLLSIVLDCPNLMD